MGCGSSAPTDGKASPDRKEGSKRAEQPQQHNDSTPREQAKQSSPRKEPSRQKVNEENRHRNSPRRASFPNKTNSAEREEDEVGDTQNNDRGFKKHVRQKLLDATKHGDIEELSKMVELFEKHKLEDCGDLRRAKERLYFLKLKKDLRDAVMRRHVGVLEKTIDEAKSSKYADRLQSQIEAAERLRQHLAELKNCSHDVCKMEQCTISELRSYQRPPACVHDVMAATYMLMGYPEDGLSDWSEIQTHLGQLTSEKLIRQVSQFDTKNVTEDTAQRVKAILRCYSLDEVQSASNGAATFFIWSNNIVEKIEKDQAEEEERMQQTQEPVEQPTKNKGSGKRKG